MVENRGLKYNNDFFWNSFLAELDVKTIKSGLAYEISTWSTLLSYSGDIFYRLYFPLTGSFRIVYPDGAALIRYTFSQWYYVVIYLVWFVALWFHLTHGVWSMFQSVGWANDTWYPRLKCIANIVATIVFLGFAIVVLVYFLCPCMSGAC